MQRTIKVKRACRGKCGTSRPHHAKGYCQACYMKRYRKGGEGVDKKPCVV